MRVIIAGDREVTEYSVIERAIEASGFEITEVVEGGARGADKLARQWAIKNKIPYTTFEARWNDITRTGAVIKERKNPFTGKNEKYDTKAGHFRNEQMASYAEALIAIQINGPTPGTQNMIKHANYYDLKVYVYEGEDSDYENHF